MRIMDFGKASKPELQSKISEMETAVVDLTHSGNERTARHVANNLKAARREFSRKGKK
jgi:hypothetical protein